MVFDYKRKATYAQIFGKSYEIPTRTSYFVNEVNRLHAEIAKASDAVKSTELTLEGIALFLGDKFVRDHYDAPVPELDTDEIGALWLFLNSASAKATEEVLKQYAPHILSD